MSAEGGIYLGGLTDSRRWAGFEFRPDDIVISAPSKCGTTWMQMIMALLIFQSPELPAPLSDLSPWLDIRARTSADVRAQLESQGHRRFIKTHTPPALGHLDCEALKVIKVVTIRGHPARGG